MRQGLLMVGGGVPLGQIVETARVAEAEGLDSIYCVEAYRSAFVPLSAIAAATTRITLGPYILNAYGHSPFIAGLGAIDLDERDEQRLDTFALQCEQPSEHPVGVTLVPPHGIADSSRDACRHRLGRVHREAHVPSPKRLSPRL